MIGTFLNVGAIIAGSLLGIIFGNRLPERFHQTIVSAMGLFVAALGIQMFLKTGNPLIVLGSLLIGGLLGEWWRIEDGLKQIGHFLEKYFSKEEPEQASLADAGQSIPAGASRFLRGFLTASLLFCIGPIAILGSISDGLTGDYRLLAIKSVLDGFASLAFASSLGIGVAFSSLIILVYQGGISLLAAQAQSLATPAMINELTATGGVLLLGIAFSNLLEIKTIRVGNLLPSLFIAPIIVAILTFFHLF